LTTNDTEVQVWTGPLVPDAPLAPDELLTV
jgi:hypothetical protein